MDWVAPLAQEQAANLLSNKQFCNTATLCQGTLKPTYATALGIPVTQAFHFALDDTRESKYQRKKYVGLEPKLQVKTLC